MIEELFIAFIYPFIYSRCYEPMDESGEYDTK